MSAHSADTRPEGEWRVLGVLACERRLAESAVERLLREHVPDAAATPRVWIEARLEDGALLDVGAIHTYAALGKPHGERALAVSPEIRTAALRRLGDAGELEATRDTARALAGDTSVASFVAALYGGDRARLERALPDLKWRFPRDAAAPYARTLLREALCAPFDAAWLERTWRDDAELLATHVLEDALYALVPVDGLYAWALDRARTSESGLVAIVLDHAVLRGDTDALRLLGPRLPPAIALAFEGARKFLEGDRAGAHASFDESLAWAGRSKAPSGQPTSLRTLGALLAASRKTPETLATAKRLLRRSASEEQPLLRGYTPAPGAAVAGRAVRTLLKTLTRPRHERGRLDAYQLPVDASAWETLILALAVHLDEEATTSRAAWSMRLERDAARWEVAGYAWFARQARSLAAALGRPDAGAAERLEDGLCLDALFEPEPEWRKSLEALRAFAEQRGRAPERSRRLVWFVDMGTGRLSKPAIEEFRSSTGWTRTRRADPAELVELLDELPAEDAAVVARFDRTPGLALGPEILEALCGHPRVFSAAQKSLPVEVVRAACRLSVRQEQDQLVLSPEPASAEPGVHVVVEPPVRVLVYRVTEAAAKLTSLLPLGLRVPASHADEVLPVLARLAEHVEVQSSELAAHRPRNADATPCLRISAHAGAFWVEFGVRPFGAAGRFFPPGIGRAHLNAYHGGELLATHRDLEEEERRFAALVARCPTWQRAVDRQRGEDEGDAMVVGADGETAIVGSPAREPLYSLALGEEELLALLVELRDSGSSGAIEWKSGRAVRVRGTLTAKSLRGRLRRVKRWYLVTGGVRLDDVTELALAELATMPFTQSGRFVRLPNGDFVEVERRIRATLLALKAHATNHAGPTRAELKIPDAALATVRALAEPDSGLEVDASAADWLSTVEATLAREYPTPSGLNATLRPYQAAGYAWLCRYAALGLGACLADDMGLGKTVQVIALLLQRVGAGPALVVAPTSVCSNWMDELARFAPSLRAVEYGPKTRASLLDELTTEPASPERPDVVVVSYASLQQDADRFATVDWDTVVLDEAQFIKNAHSLRARAAYRLRARTRVALTGTPVENHLGDLFSIFHFLEPDLLGTFREFQVRFLNPIERNEDGDRRERLRALVQPFILRRTKAQVLTELPPLTVVRHEIRLSEQEARLYGLLRRQIDEKFASSRWLKGYKVEIFAELTRLRRFCCHPRLVFPEASTECSKLDAFLELAEELRQNGHRALVFSQFVDFLEIVREQLDERGISYLYLDGSTPKSARQGLVSAFQDGQADLFLISLKAGGFGVNLTAADYVIHLDPWWNPAVEAQATDRAHRIGQTRPVTVYRLITKETIEERIVDIHQDKLALADTILAGSDLPARLSADDLRALLAAPGPTP